MHLTSVKQRQHRESLFAILVHSAFHRQSYKYLVSVQPGILPVQETGLGALYWLYHLLRYELGAVRDAGKVLGRVDDERGARSEKRT